MFSDQCRTPLVDKYQYIFFDVANTLLYKPSLYDRIKTTLDDFDILVDIKTIEIAHRLLTEVIDFPFETSKAFYLEFNHRLLSAIGVMPSMTLIEAIYHNCKDLRWVVFEDVKALKLIDRPLGILSNWDKTLEKRVNDCLGISFFKIVSSYSVGISKPNSQLFELLISDLDCQPGDILYIGDSIRLDMYPAQEVGMETMLIDRKNHFPFYNCTKINSFDELIRTSPP